MNNLIKSMVLKYNRILHYYKKSEYVLNVDKKLKNPKIKQICQELFNTKKVQPINSFNNDSSSFNPQKSRTNKIQDNKKRVKKKSKNLKENNSNSNDLNLVRNMWERLEEEKKKSNFQEKNNLKQFNLKSSKYNWSDLLEFFSKLPKNENSKNEENEEKTHTANSPRFFFMHEKKFINPPNIYSKTQNIFDLKNLIDHFEKDNLNSIGFNFHSLPIENSYIVLDIDDKYIGEKIIFLIKSQLVSFQKIFGNPLVIQSETAGHLHLYYKSNKKILNEEDKKKNKIKHCTRLGFAAEYIFGNITFASQKRSLLKVPENLNDISELPTSLYPYNYYPNSEFFSLINGIPYEPNRFPDSEFIPKGRRNEFLYHFFKYDNFSQDHVFMTNFLLCNPPIENEKELIDSCVNRRFKDKKIESEAPSFKFSQCELFPTKSKEFYRLRIDDDYPKINYHFIKNKKIFTRKTMDGLVRYNFNPDRIDKALYQQTSEETILLVGYLEKENNFFFKDDEWLGQSPEDVLLHYFLKYNNYEKFILHINQEENWYFWEKTHWKLSSSKLINNRFSTFIKKKVPIAGSGFRLLKNTNAIANAMLDYVSIEHWPNNKTRGINFQNGVLLAKEKHFETYLEKHNPQFYHRYCLPCDYFKNAVLTPLQARFILDICSENNWSINVFRYILLLILCPQIAQVGLFLNSNAGSSKSTFIRLIRQIFPDGVVTLSMKDLKDGNSFLDDYVSGRQVLIINDVSPQNLKNSSINDYIKQYLGKDTRSAQKKHKNFYQSFNQGFLILVSNSPSTQIPLFKDNAIIDRLINFTTPVIKNNFKITNLENIIMENLSGLINWILACPYEYLNRFIRVGGLNKVFSLESQKSLMTHFIQDHLVFVPETGKGSKVLLPNNDIIVHYRNFQAQFEEKETSFKTNESILKEFDFTIDHLIDDQKKHIQKGRRAKFRGYYCIALKSRLLQELKKGKKKNSYFSFDQILDIEEIKFEKDKAIINLLNQNSFSYNGILTTTINDSKFVVTNQSFPQIEKDCYQLTSLIQSYSCKDLIKHFPFHAQPFHKNYIPLLETGSDVSNKSSYESAIELTDFPQGSSIYSSSFYQENNLPMPVSQLQPITKKTPLLIGSSLNPIDYVMQELKNVQFYIGFQSSNSIKVFPFSINDLSYYTIESNNILYNEKNPAKQLQKFLVNSLINKIIENIQRFPTFKEMFYIFYYSYIDILVSEELILNILKPGELIDYVFKSYPSYGTEISHWDKEKFLKLFDQLITNRDFYNFISNKKSFDLYSYEFIPCYFFGPNILFDCSNASLAEIKDAMK